MSELRCLLRHLAGARELLVGVRKPPHTIVVGPENKRPGVSAAYFQDFDSDCHHPARLTPLVK